MLVAFVSTLAFLALGGALHRFAGLSQVAVSLILCLVSVALWMVSLRLHNRLMAKRTAQEEGRVSGRKSHTEIALHWTTQLTNLAFGVALAAVIPLLQAVAP